MRAVLELLYIWPESQNFITVLPKLCAAIIIRATTVALMPLNAASTMDRSPFGQIYYQHNTDK